MRNRSRIWERRWETQDPAGQPRPVADPCNPELAGQPRTSWIREARRCREARATPKSWEPSNPPNPAVTRDHEPVQTKSPNPEPSKPKPERPRTRRSRGPVTCVWPVSSEIRIARDHEPRNPSQISATTQNPRLPATRICFPASRGAIPMGISGNYLRDFLN
jgi:hypothetical protein